MKNYQFDLIMMQLYFITMIVSKDTKIKDISLIGSILWAVFAVIHMYKYS